MRPSYEIFNFSLASYGTLIFIGLLLGLLTSLLLTKKYQPQLKDDVFYSFLFGFIGVALGGKLLYIITILPRLIKAVQNNLPVKIIIPLLVSGGFVFYGSLIGACLAIYIYSKAFSVPAERLLYFLVPAIPLIHSIGRLGCLAAGCCYGIPSPGFGYFLNQSLIAPQGIKLFPTQLLESIYCFIIFIIILFFFKKIKNGYKLLAIYILLYTPFRFIIEFFRGDLARGKIGLLSTSQIISLIIIFLVLILFINNLHKNKNR
ncbi:MAG TPA: prolipoprotein diacylglyceryl transferase family protein [Candidatus Eisenbacteria bacterium]|nr:prolipoprotein diacylglyceryl transferase family protein [Candidatus Eisenbacteria bacterium]